MGGHVGQSDPFDTIKHCQLARGCLKAANCFLFAGLDCLQLGPLVSDEFVELLAALNTRDFVLPRARLEKCGRRLEASCVVSSR